MDYRGELITNIKVEEKDFNENEFIKGAMKIVEMEIYNINNIFSRSNYSPDIEACIMFKSAIDEKGFEISIKRNSANKITEVQVLAHGLNITDSNLRYVVDLAMKNFKLKQQIN